MKFLHLGLGLRCSGTYCAVYILKPPRDCGIKHTVLRAAIVRHEIKELSGLVSVYC